ncbi:TonB-dependent receptor [Sphingomonas lutea]|uniref:TonB-dependent receptor n=1 Tax=Sphingomonas lutea TaxID=1045317 RepID=A0A7G9SJT3_9SPHN|nr:TonB-dependent receptor [Sphingomonas lutea]QNN68108.1 TonB-dependent receptor [Sphingomonas lutea]
MSKSLRRALLLATLSTFAIAIPAAAQDAQSDVPATPESSDATPAAPAGPAPTVPQAVNEDTIIVTGTRSSNRTVADSPVPVDVIGADAIAHTGATETNKILNQLVPSFNFPQPSVNDGSDSVKPATLRGLSPDQVLVLVNGKRRHVAALININGTVGRGSAAVDMNLIPGMAINRVEVLRDGAAAQYGSDAIAGVINIQLKNARQGGSASLTYGKYITTLEDVDDVTGLALNGAGQPFLDPNDIGTPTTTSRYFVAETDGERKARDGSQVTFAANLGLPIGSTGYVNLTGELQRKSAVNRAGYDLRPNFTFGVTNATTVFDPRELDFNRLQFKYGEPKAKSYNLFLNAGIDVSPDWEAYAFASHGHRNSTSAANWRQYIAAANRDFSVLAPNQVPNAGNFVPLTDEGFLPLIETDLDDYAATIGLRGAIAGWKADFSAGYGHNRFDYDLHDTLNTSLGPDSPRDFDAGGLRYGQWLFNADFSREFAIGTAKPLTVAVGAEHRRERFKIRPGEEASYVAGPLFRAAVPNTTLANCDALGGRFGSLAPTTCDFPGRGAGAGAQGFPGIPAASETNEGRHSWGVYAELDTDPIEGVTTTLAARFEDYSDFGTTLNGKFAARWEFIPNYAVRGAISNGFRAPSLHQQYFTTFSTNFVNGIPVDIATLAVGSPAAAALGAQPLKPEKSVNFSLGATANPVPGLTITADWYSIKIKDRIVFSEILGVNGTGNVAATGTAVTALLQSLGFPQVGAGRFFLNGIDTRTRGLDIVAAYNWRTNGFGRWNLSAAYNRNKTKITDRAPPPGALSTIPNLILFGRTESLRFTYGQPRDKIVLSADGDLGRFGVTARTTRYGKVVSPSASLPPAPNQFDVNTFLPDDIRLGRKWITDLELRWKPGGGAELALGSNNLFDVYPDRSPFGIRPDGGVYPVNQIYFPYSTFSPFGFNGRFIYGRASINF